MAADIRTLEKNRREAVASGSHEAVKRLLADTMTFHSQAIFEPPADCDCIDRVLRFVNDAFEDSHYTEVYGKPKGLAVAGKIKGRFVALAAWD